MLLSSTQVTKLKIQNIKRQIMMLEYYVKANEITSKIIGQMNGLLGIGLVAQQLVVENNIRNYKKELNGLTMDFDSNIAEIDGFTTSIESSKKPQNLLIQLRKIRSYNRHI